MRHRKRERLRICSGRGCCRHSPRRASATAGELQGCFQHGKTRGTGIEANRSSPLHTWHPGVCVLHPHPQSSSSQGDPEQQDRPGGLCKNAIFLLLILLSLLPNDPVSFIFSKLSLSIPKLPLLLSLLSSTWGDQEGFRDLQSTSPFAVCLFSSPFPLHPQPLPAAGKAAK